MQKIVTHLWFHENADGAAKFYVSLFPNSKILAVTHYGDAAAEVSGMQKGEVMTVAFQLDGQDFLALNGGPLFTFNEAVSLLINCETQEEIDTLWAKLTADGGQESQCGWLKDKYGLSWQVVPRALDSLLQDEEKGERVMEAFLPMKKINIAALQAAYDGGQP